MAQADFFLPRTDMPNAWRRYLVDGVRASLATTASTQVTGAAGLTTVNVNESAGHVALPGLGGLGDAALIERAATADVELASGTDILTTVGNSIVVTRVAYRHHSTGVVTYVNFVGAEAVDGAEVATTDAVITAQLGDSTPWMRLYEVTVNRSADTVLELTYDNLKRPIGVARSDGALMTSEL